MVSNNKLFKTLGELEMVKKVILLGRKMGAGQALQWLLEKNIEVSLVVADPKENRPGNLSWIAQPRGIPVYFDETVVYQMIRGHHPAMTNVNLVISYLYPKKIREPLFKLGQQGCVNFHPAPLPDYKSRAGYNTAILEQKDHFGVSAHFIDSEEFDSGPIIKVLRFPIDSKTETAFSLEKKTQIKLWELFMQTMELFLSDQVIETTENSGGTYWTRQDMEKFKIIDPAHDSSEDIDRKIRAFFFPPHSGATIPLAGKEYTLINQEILELYAKFIQ